MPSTILQKMQSFIFVIDSPNLKNYSPAFIFSNSDREWIVKFGISNASLGFKFAYFP